MVYKASLDKPAKIITILSTILFAFLTILLEFSNIKHTGKISPHLIPVVFWITYFAAFILRPISYIVTTGKLTIHRPLNNVQIDRSKIVTVELLGKEKLKGSIRTFGSGGFFGYFGKFTKAGLGSMTFYATRKDKMVLIRTIDNKKIILTPDEPEKFVANFNGI